MTDTETDKDSEKNICPLCGEEYETEEEMRRCIDECAMEEANLEKRS